MTFHCRETGRLNLNMKDLDVAKNRLNEAGLTLVIVKDENVIFESKLHGVSSFLEAIKRLDDQLENSSVADRVVGMAVALLCVYSHIKAVYGENLSRRAKTFLEENDVYSESTALVERILNAERTGTCPFEQLVQRIRSPKVAYRKLVQTCSVNRAAKPKR
jgi:butyrate kinase